MNVTELARKLRINSNDLLEILPQYGFDIGKRAIKIDNTIATKIIYAWPKIRKEMEFKKRQAKQKESEAQIEASLADKQDLYIPAILTVRDFAALLGIPVVEIIKRLMANGIMATVNHKIDFDTASIIADDLKITLHLKGEDTGVQTDQLKEHLDKDTNLTKRPPVIVIMGHVDHGKTTLLDTIRKENVAGGEAGGITQHIGAYQINHNGKIITFIDTPGHEAFTAMRSRGAKIADIAILVVAADDSLKPQTLEALKIIQQAQIPMVVAINKIDKDGANPARVRQDLAAQNVLSEEWGGKIIVEEISAKKNIGIDKLLESILLIDEMEADKIVANQEGPAVGTVIESHVDKSEGPVATLLIQSGILHPGDQMIINDVYFGKARSLRNYLNQTMESAKPAEPVKIIGLKFAPKVGDFMKVSIETIERSARKVKEYGTHKEESAVAHLIRSRQDQDGTNLPKLNVIIKADTLGSLEVLVESLEKLSTDKVQVKIIKQALGSVSENDVTRAEKDQAMILAFNVKALQSAEGLARDKNVHFKEYKVIYNLIDDVKAKLESLIKPEVIKKVLGKIKILAIFKAEKNGMILGAKVMEGIVVKDAKADVIRAGSLYEKGTITQVQSGKQEVNEVSEGNDCGIKYQGSTDVLVGDILEIYREELKEVKL